MPRLVRPYIPLAVRVEVAETQVVRARPALGFHDVPVKPLRARLAALLRKLFGDRPCALDHDPALINRRKYQRNPAAKIIYDPPANDPRFLVYRESGPGSDHDIKTRVRGDGAKLSDLAEARKRKRVDRNRKLGRGASPAIKITAVKSGLLMVGDTVTWPNGRKGKIVGVLPKRSAKEKRAAAEFFRSVKKIAGPTNISFASVSRSKSRPPKRKWASRPFPKRRKP